MAKLIRDSEFTCEGCQNITIDVKCNRNKNCLMANNLASQIGALYQITPEQREKIKEIVLEIRQYLCNTEFAPEPFTEAIDPNKLIVEFPNKILSLLQQEKEPEPPQELMDGIARQLLAGWIAIDKGETRLQALNYIDDA